MIGSMDIGSYAGIILDAVAVIIVLVSTIVGIKKGLVKMIVGFISSIIVLALAIMTVMPLTEYVGKRTDWDDKLASSLETPLTEYMGLPEPYIVIKYAEDADSAEGKKLVFIDEEGNEQDFDAIFENHDFFSLIKMNKILEPALEHALKTNETVYLGKAVAAYATVAIIAAGVFLAVFIAGKIIFAIILAILKKVTSQFYIAHFANKFSGAVLGLVFGLVGILIFVTALQFLSRFAFMDPVTVGISQSYIVKPIAENNFLFELLSGASGVFKKGYESFLNVIKTLLY